MEPDPRRPPRGMPPFYRNLRVFGAHMPYEGIPLGIPRRDPPYEGPILNPTLGIPGRDPPLAQQAANRRFPEFERVPEHSGFGNPMAKKLYESSLKGETTDVELIFGKFDESDAPRMHVHSAVLKTGSKVFNVWMTECWSSEFIKTADGKTLISLPEDDFQDFQLFIKLLYGYQNFDTEGDCYEEAIPVFRTADKFEAEDVMNFCNVYFYSLTRNFEQVNVAKVMLLAQKYRLDLVYDAGLEYVKRHPLLIIEKEPLDWAKLHENFLIEILSTDNLMISRTVDEHNWRLNEKNLFRIALTWLQNKETVIAAETGDDSESSAPPAKRCRLDSQVAVQILQNIRFIEMNADDLKECLQQLVGFLTPHQIGTIYLVHSGTPQAELSAMYGDEGSFIVETRKRQVQDPNVKIEPNQSVNVDHNYNQPDHPVEPRLQQIERLGPMLQLPLTPELRVRIEEMIGARPLAPQ